MRLALVTLACGLSLVACGGEGGDAALDDTAGLGTPAAGRDTGTATAATPGGAITATMRDSAGRDVGVLTLTDTTGGIVVAGALRGLPAGEHAIHLHMTGQCEPPFTSAGGHWNPTNRQHGRENPQGPHLGDMPNITVAADSTTTVRVMTPGGSLRGENALLDGDGAAVVIHATADDHRTDPAGDAGARIACGVVSGT